uniref:Ig-like domain-containing protein n=1 Tax=Equus asinus TaxID=9793 RepID=A0A9L0K0P6_EQUAS
GTRKFTDISILYLRELLPRKWRRKEKKELFTKRLLSHVLMKVKKISMEEGLCTTISGIFEFPEESPSNSMILAYWLNKNTTSPVDTNQPMLPWSIIPRTDSTLFGILRKKTIPTYLFYADLGEHKNLIPKPELHIPEILVAEEPVTLTCTFKGTCKETKAPLLSWKEPITPSNTDSSSNSSTSSSVLCHLNFSLANLTKSSMLKLQAVSPPRLLYSSCSLKKTLQCSCSFQGIPTPSVQWLMDRVPVSVNSMSNILHMTSSVSVPWANSTISLTGDPEIVTKLHCEGKNEYGIHTSSIFLIPHKNSVSNVFLKGLIQGVVYGSIASALLCFFFVLLTPVPLSHLADVSSSFRTSVMCSRKPSLALTGYLFRAPIAIWALGN